jgi:pyruvate dehydrogenase (quinone)
MYPATQSIPDFPYARFAELVGLTGIRVDEPDALGPAWDDALAAGRPAVLEVVVDPEVPPLPPHITFEQAKHFAEAALHGDPRRGQMIRQSFRQMVDALLPRR